MIHPIVRTDIERICQRLGAKVAALSGKTVLVTGATGLIGSYIVETLAYLNDQRILKKSAAVIGIQKRPVSASDRLGYLLGRPDVFFVAGNAAAAYAPSRKADYLIHSAGASAPAFFLSDPLAAVDINVGGIRWILDYAKNSGATSVLYMSSGEIYGNPPGEHIPTPETYHGNVSTFDTRAPYTSSKRLAETLCRIYFEKYAIPVKIARPFIVYGPGLTTEDRRVMADFIRSGLEGKPIEMLSEGLDTRSYCYIADATVAFFDILLSDRNGEAFNVASDLEEVSIADLARLVHKITGIESPVKIKSKDAAFIRGAPHRVRPDITKLKKTFGFMPEIRIAEGMRRTIEWNKTRFTAS